MNINLQTGVMREKFLNFRAIMLLMGMVMVSIGCSSSQSNNSGNQTNTGNNSTSQASNSLTDATLLAVGNSYFAWNRDSEQSIPDEIAKSLGTSIENRAVSGAQFLSAPDEIRLQYSSGEWPWVLVDGGGNDLLQRCGCLSCDATMNELISANGQRGALRDFVQTITNDGSKVLVMGYPALPDTAQFGFDRCTDELNEMSLRANMMASQLDNVWFVSARDVVPSDNLDYFDTDRVHPSPLAGATIGSYIADTIRANNE